MFLRWEKCFVLFYYNKFLKWTPGVTPNTVVAISDLDITLSIFEEELQAKRCTRTRIRNSIIIQPIYHFCFILLCRHSIASALYMCFAYLVWWIMPYAPAPFHLYFLFLFHRLNLTKNAFLQATLSGGRYLS